MKHILAVIPLFLLLTLLAGCGQRTRVEAQLDTLDSILSIPPDGPEALVDYDSIFHQLDSLQPSVIGDDALEARWNLLFTMTEDKSDRPLLLDLRIRPAYDYYAAQTQDGTRGDSTLLHRFAQSCFYLGAHYYQCDSLARMEQLMHRSAEVSKSCGDHYTAYLALTYLSGALAWSNPETAIPMADDALKEYSLCSHKSQYNEYCLLLNKVFVDIQSNHQNDSTLSVLNRLLERRDEQINPIEYGNVLGYFALLYLFRNDPGTALTYLQKSLAYLPENYKHNLYMADIYIQNDSLERAKLFLEKELQTDNPQKPYAFLQLIKIALQQHRYSDVPTLSDSLFTSSNAKIYQEIKKNYGYYVEKLDQEQQYNELNRKKNLQREVFIISLVLLLAAGGLISFLIYNRAKRREQELQYEKVLKEQELQQKVKVVEMLRRHLADKSEIIDTFKSIGREGKEYAKIKPEDWIYLEKTLDEIDANYIGNLRVQHPHLDENSFQLAMLIRIGLTNTQIAAVFNLTVEAIKKRKQKLRRDVNVTSLS